MGRSFRTAHNSLCVFTFRAASLSPEPSLDAIFPSPWPSDSLAPPRSARGPSPLVNSFRCFPSSSSPLGRGRSHWATVIFDGALECNPVQFKWARGDHVGRGKRSPSLRSAGQGLTLPAFDGRGGADEFRCRVRANVWGSSTVYVFKEQRGFWSKRKPADRKHPLLY